MQMSDVQVKEPLTSYAGHYFSVLSHAVGGAAPAAVAGRHLLYSNFHHRCKQSIFSSSIVSPLILAFLRGHKT